MVLVRGGDDEGYHSYPSLLLSEEGRGTRREEGVSTARLRECRAKESRVSEGVSSER